MELNNRFWGGDEKEKTNSEREEMSPNSEGTSPVSSLSKRSRKLRSLSCPNSEGMGPSRLLSGKNLLYII